MRKQLLDFKLSLFAFAFLLFTSCDHQDLDVYVENENYSNATDFIGNNFNLSLFHAALKQADLLDMLKEKGPYTLFAPNDKAFNDLGIVRASDFATMNQDSLRDMLLYHILPRRLYTSDVPRKTIDNKYPNMLDKELFIGYNYQKFCVECTTISDMYINGAKSVFATQDMILANGVLHMIDKVLKYKPTLQEVLLSQPDYSLFIAFLKKTGNWDRLAESTFTTVFAPDNAAFEAAGLSMADITNLDPTMYHKRLSNVYILHNHFFLSDMIIYGQLAGSGYYGSPYYRARIVGDEDYYFGISASTPIEPFIIHSQSPNPNVPIRIGSFQSAHRTDYKADNGLVHGIKGLLVLPSEAKIN